MSDAAADSGIPDEYENRPVPDKALKGPSSFWGMYAGEHTAGTEFMIGPLFVAYGVGAGDLILGLLLGNLAAVLTWRYLTTTVSMRLRVTLYHKLEKICGRNLVSVYNLSNGLLFCFLAGAMVTVSATAVGVPFPEVRMPSFSDTMPTGIAWSTVVLVIGAAMTVVAMRG
jgi:nucleobase:cation symporter-1, NCS1 family